MGKSGLVNTKKESYADEDFNDKCCRPKCRRLGIWYSQTGKAYCNTCWNNYKAKCAYQARQREAGLCQCGKETAEGKSTCEACLATKEKRRLKKRSEGLCSCGRKAISGKKLCKSCADSKRKWQKKTHGMNRQNGLCRCGQKPLPGTKRCQRCRDKEAARLKARKQAV